MDIYYGSVEFFLRRHLALFDIDNILPYKVFMLIKRDPKFEALNKSNTLISNDQNIRFK